MAGRRGFRSADLAHRLRGNALGRHGLGIRARHDGGSQLKARDAPNRQCPFRWVRFELSPAVLVAAAIFSAANLVDAALRFGERSILLPLLLGDADPSE